MHKKAVIAGAGILFSLLFTKVARGSDAEYTVDLNALPTYSFEVDPLFRSHVYELTFRTSHGSDDALVLEKQREKASKEAFRDLAKYVWDEMRGKDPKQRYESLPSQDAPWEFDFDVDPRVHRDSVGAKIRMNLPLPARLLGYVQSDGRAKAGIEGYVGPARVEVGLEWEEWKEDPYVELSVPLQNFFGEMPQDAVLFGSYKGDDERIFVGVRIPFGQ